MSLIDWPSTLTAPMQFGFQGEEGAIENALPFQGAFFTSPLWDRWRAYAQWNNMPMSQALAIRMHLSRARGKVNQLRIPSFDYRSLIGSNPGALALSSAVTAGTFTAPTNASGLAPGDRICATGATASQIHEIQVAAGTTYTIWPAWREDHASGKTLRHLGTHTYLELHCAMVIAGELPRIEAQPSPGNDKFAVPFAVEFIEDPTRV